MKIQHKLSSEEKKYYEIVKAWTKIAGFYICPNHYACIKIMENLCKRNLIKEVESNDSFKEYISIC